MSTQIHFSDSLVGSLCREVDTIRNRHSYINRQLSLCIDGTLLIRLENEKNTLINRQKEILIIAKSININLHQDNISVKLLIEMSQRSLNTSNKN